MNYITCAVVAI